MNLHNVFLISENTIKKRSLVTDPTLSYLIKPAIELAQKEGLRGIIGDCLLDKIKMLVSTKDETSGEMLINLTEYARYKFLLQNYITDYLVYKTMSEIVIPMRDKMRNAGVVNNVDNNYQQPDFSETTYTKRYWEDHAEYFGTALREYVLENITDYPEYTSCDSCNNKNGKLESTYHCGIVL